VKIDRLEVVPYALPFRQPYMTARGRLERRELALVRLHADGLVGVGETAALVLRGGDPLAAIVAELERCGTLLAGSDVEPARWAEPADRVRSEASAPALAAIEVALLDLAGKMAGAPAWRVLGAAKAGAIECNATLTAGSPANVADQALAWAERGFRSFKLKVGMEGDVEQASAAREALGPKARLRVDANGSWSVEDAGARLEALGPLELAEEPVSGLEAMARLRNEGGLPLADDNAGRLPLVADESVASVVEAKRAKALSACDLATAKLAKVGGPTAVLAIEQELRLYLSSALEGPVGIAAAAHVAQALRFQPAFAQGLATQLLFADTIASRECELDGPMLSCPHGPGLGVELDESALARHRL
jgi:L-alanine-DL-glutamate epimerase-like enolase superfamily enzyme